MTPALRSRYLFVIGAHYSTEKNSYLNSHLRLTAKSVLLHPKYDPNTKINDIALVELSQPVDLSDKTIGFICLPKSTLRFPKLFPTDRADAVRIDRDGFVLMARTFLSGGDRMGTCPGGFSRSS